MSDGPKPSFLAVIKKRLQLFDLDVALQAPRGITVLFGASGSGKTTLLKSIAGLLTPDSGSVRLGDAVLYDSEAGTNLPPARRRIGYVFQSLALFPHLTSEQNIAYGLNQLEAGERSRRIDEILAAFRIARIRTQPPGSISGGEQQRVALARTLVTDPRALLLDEPLSALDPGTKSLIMDDLRAWIADRKIPALYVTHSREEVFAMAHNVIALEKGRVVGSGTPREVLGGSQHEAIAEWNALENILEGSITFVHEQQGTMTFRTGAIELEVPLARQKLQHQLRVGVSAHDILLAISPPAGLSARNILRGRIVTMELHDTIVNVVVNCDSVQFKVHVTPGAVHSLDLRPTTEVWVVIKTHSCFLINP